jgi:hypothetical protein
MYYLGFQGARASPLLANGNGRHIRAGRDR